MGVCVFVFVLMRMPVWPSARQDEESCGRPTVKGTHR